MRLLSAVTSPHVRLYTPLLALVLQTTKTVMHTKQGCLHPKRKQPAIRAIILTIRPGVAISAMMRRISMVIFVAIINAFTMKIMDTMHGSVVVKIAIIIC